MLKGVHNNGAWELKSVYIGAKVFWDDLSYINDVCVWVVSMCVCSLGEDYNMLYAIIILIKKLLNFNGLNIIKC